MHPSIDRVLERRRWAAPLTLALLMCIGAFLLLRDLDRGWVPHDEGTLGQAAERVLRGEVPHRDFDDPYSGLLTYMNAAAFRVAGVSVNTLRWPLFVWSLLWLAAVNAVARRFASPAGAALTALTCLALSVPNYRAPMPSWYLLFLATFGMLAVVRWHESGRRRWIIAAGICGGLAVLVKLTGIVQLVGCALAFWAATPQPADRGPATATLHQLRVAMIAALGSGLALLAMLALSAGERMAWRLVPPFTLLVWTLAYREWTSGGGTAVDRLRILARVLGPYLAGVAIPLAIFTVFFTIESAGPDLLVGTFITPWRRLNEAMYLPPSPGGLLWSLPVVFILWPRRDGRMAAVARGVGIIWFGTIVLASARDPRWYQAGWASVWSLPMLVAASLALPPLFSRAFGHGTPRRDMARSIAIIAVSGMLIEFPFAAPIYTLYAVPLSVLGLFAAVQDWEHVSRRAVVLVGVFLLAFAALRLNPGTIYSLGIRYRPGADSVMLSVPRARLRVMAEDASDARALVSILGRIGAGRTLWAGPDAPEVYFLAGLPNRTRTFFEFLDRTPDAARDIPARVQAIGASIVVIKRRPEFSPVPSFESVAAVRQMFPRCEDLAEYLICWR
ncbi:MAG: hypothetical protein C0497_08925 [Gemmatimonas sp.]|nr:hypothetical protein [Gemmatimonas sp.]